MVEVEKVIPLSQLEQSLRDTPLLRLKGGEKIYPYADANIELREVSYTDVDPTTYYVVRNRLAIQHKIGRDLDNEGFHPLELEVGLVLVNEESSEKVGFVPPIVEETEEDGLYLLDGAHRASQGRWCGRTTFMALHISGIRPDCPSYALPNSWDLIRILEEVPKDPAHKKNYREGDYKKLYRDFATLNGSRLREG